MSWQHFQLTCRTQTAFCFETVLMNFNSPLERSRVAGDVPVLSGLIARIGSD